MAINELLETYRQELNLKGVKIDFTEENYLELIEKNFDPRILKKQLFFLRKKRQFPLVKDLIKNLTILFKSNSSVGRNSKFSATNEGMYPKFDRENDNLLLGR